MIGRKKDSHVPPRIQWRKWDSEDCYHPDQTAAEVTTPAAAPSPSQIPTGTLMKAVSLNHQLTDCQVLLFLGVLFLTRVGGSVRGSETSDGYL